LSSAKTRAKAYQRLRRSPRCRIDVSIQVSVFHEGQTTTYWGRATELGENGMGATLGGELQIGEVVSVEFPVPLPPNVMKLRAVVRYGKGLRYGFEFLVVPDEQKLALRQVCEALTNGS
jgi:PilZ domain